MISGTAVTSDPIAVDYSLTPTIGAPAVESASTDVLPAGIAIVTGSAAPNTRTFVYIKNVGSVSQSYITVSLTGATDSMRLNLGEFLYIPISPAQVVTLDVPAETTGAAEYGYFSAE